MFQASLLPVNVFKQLAEEEKGETARLVCMHTQPTLMCVLCTLVVSEYICYLLLCAMPDDHLEDTTDSF